MLIDDELKGKESAQTLLASTSTRFKIPKKRLIHTEEDNHGDTLPPLSAQGNAKKRAKCTHLDVGATEDDDTNPRSEKHQ